MADKPEDDGLDGALEVIVDPPEGGGGNSGAETPVISKVVEPEEGIEALREKLAASETARQAEAERARQAEARARDANKTADERAQETADTNIALVSNAIEMVKQSLDVAETAYAAALESGDFPGAAKIQREMLSDTAKLQTMEAGKVQLEAAAKAPKREPAQTDPLEAFLENIPDPRAKDWLRARPQYARDPKLNRQMIRAHEDAVDEGVVPNSDAYYDYIETKLGLKKAVVEVDESALSEAATTRVVAPPAAPVGRGNGTGTVVRLTSAQREVAEMNGMSEKEYAAQLLRARANGEIQ